ncbi:MAG: hypothetical protein KatS3mg110_1586 [Pirellulaceae bacterium]|nr:MAG: hypothetical protein KatS3mg110_1586 [Pirellulaceae bacterium]
MVGLDRRRDNSRVLLLTTFLLNAARSVAVWRKVMSLASGCRAQLFGPLSCVADRVEIGLDPAIHFR